MLLNFLVSLYCLIKGRICHPTKRGKLLRKVYQTRPLCQRPFRSRPRPGRDELPLVRKPLFCQEPLASFRRNTFPKTTPIAAQPLCFLDPSSPDLGSFGNNRLSRILVFRANAPVGTRCCASAVDRVTSLAL